MNGIAEDDHEDRYKEDTPADTGETGDDTDEKTNDEVFPGRSVRFADFATVHVPYHADGHHHNQESKERPEDDARKVGGEGPPGKPPKIAAQPIVTAARQFTASRLWWASAPLIMVGIITARDVPKASRVARVLSIPPSVYSQNWTGVIRNPPPTPKSPDQFRTGCR